MGYSPHHADERRADREPPPGHALIVTVPEDAAEQLTDLLRDAAWLVPGRGDRPDEAALAELAHSVVGLVRGWPVRGRHGTPANDRTEDQPLPAIDAATATIDRAELLTGRAVRRACDAARGGRLRTSVPCCARTILLAHTTDDGTEHAVCCGCRLAYAVFIADEGDDGWGNHSYAALFTVSNTVVVATHRRSPP